MNCFKYVQIFTAETQQMGTWYQRKQLMLCWVTLSGLEVQIKATRNIFVLEQKNISLNKNGIKLHLINHFKAFCSHQQNAALHLLQYLSSHLSTCKYVWNTYLQRKHHEPARVFIQNPGVSREHSHPRTFGATRENILAKITWPTRAKRIWLRNVVNHITHSKSAASYSKEKCIRIK